MARTVVLPPQLTGMWRRKYASLVVVLILIQVAPAALAPEQWLGWSPATASAFLLGTTWTALIAAIVSTWMSGTLNRVGMMDRIRTSSRGIEGSLAAILFSLIAAVVIANICAFGLLSAMSAFYGQSQFRSPPTTLLVLLVSVGASSAWITFGMLLGIFVRAEIALPVVMCACYGTYAVPVLYLFDTPLVGVLPYDGRSWIYESPDPTQLAVRGLAWGSLALLLGALLMRRKRLAEWAAWACIGLASAGIFLGGDLRDIPGARSSVCRAGEAVVCVDRAHAAVLDDYSQIANEGLRILPEDFRPKVVSAVAQSDDSLVLASESPSELNGFGTVAAGPTYKNTEPSMIVDRDASLIVLGESMFNGCTESTEESASSRVALSAWWRLRHGITLDAPIVPGTAPWIGIDELASTVDTVRRVEMLPMAEQETWVRHEALQATECWRGE